jgi:hypothetical protein
LWRESIGMEMYFKFSMLHVNIDAKNCIDLTPFIDLSPQPNYSSHPH